MLSVTLRLTSAIVLAEAQGGCSDPAAGHIDR